MAFTFKFFSESNIRWKKATVLLSFLLTIFNLTAQDSGISYKPSLEGTIRAKYEYNSSLNGHRFQVRNARFSFSGNVSPYARYEAEIDLSDEGQTRILDAYVEMLLSNKLLFKIGQQKVPFSTDNLRSPHNFQFANRSFLGKQLAGLRDVGATLEYTLGEQFPLELIAGVYNGKGLYNQKEWRNSLSYAIRGVYTPFKNLELQLNYNTIQPYDLRMHIFNAGFITSFRRWYFESEVYFKTYENKAFPSTEGFFVTAHYEIPMKNTRIMESISPRIRFDQMSNDNNGLINTQTGTYTTDDVKRSRITGGFTFYLRKPFINHIRLNYEQYFYADNIVNQDNKLVIEFVTKF
ncbi:MAG: porin [Paludibacter sp.]|jgi:hypothetical protein|nr:porin [Paludibacter sp.]